VILKRKPKFKGPMLISKEVVAKHEAGHALVVLATPLRPYMVEAQIFDSGGEWQGKVRIDADAATAAKVDPHCVYDFAKAIAGPLAQIAYHQDSIPSALRDTINQCGGLLLAARYIKTNNVRGCDVQWWPDLKAWLSFIHYHPHFKGADFLDVESGVVGFLKDPSVDQSLHALAQMLTNQEHLGRNELLAHTLAGVPPLVLPQRLEFR
jgi:hypothetical protein